MAANPVLKGGLRLLNAFASSGLAERYGVEEQARELVERAARLGVDLLARGGDRGASEPSAPKRRFDLTPTESQELLRTTMRRFALEVLREAADDADVALGPPAEVLEMAGELGLVELAIPEAHGGAGEERSPVTTALLAEELGYGDMALGAALLAPVSVAHLALDHGTDDQRRDLLARLRAEPFVAASAALLEPRPLFDPRRPSTRARRLGDVYRLRGEKSLVILAERARFFLVSAKLGKETRLFVVERDRPGVSVRPEPTMGLRGAGLGRLELSDVEVPAGALLGEADGFDHQRVVDLGRLAWSALAVGQGRAVLDYVKTYCNDRVAFGEPITNRQSVAFMIADIAIELEGMRLLGWRAAARAERGDPFTREAHLCAVQSAAYAMKIGTDGVQLLGGSGYIREHPVERWYRHLRAAGVMEGGLSL
ncbi:MAG: acyl-CoA dehydrogenase family protein [Sandaracinaceae bacterium]|nr:acyl-CoA dehydrogenase family protein [Sandaracinaceae bacterium]